MSAVSLAVRPARRIVHRNRGHTNGPITRLVSPGDLGRVLKPFVFLDLFDIERGTSPGIGLHPHSGIATLTYVAQGSVAYEDTTGTTGLVTAGGVEWMQAGAGVWHGGGGGEHDRTRGFQLWIALPPHLELGAPISLYQGADDVPAAGPARVLLGSSEGATSAIEAPSPMNYLAVKLEAGERWRYQPPAGHTVLWMAIGKGVVMTSARLDAGEIAVFEPGTDAVAFVGQTDTDFVLGSAVPHDHDLVLGYYSVHTSREALEKGEAQIRSIGSRLQQEGRL